MEKFSFSLLSAELMIGTQLIWREYLNARQGFSLLSAELMIGTNKEIDDWEDPNTFQSPISGVNDWNNQTRAVANRTCKVSVSYQRS